MGVRLANIEDVKSMSFIHAQTWKKAYVKYISAEYLDNITDDGWVPLFTRAFVQNLHEAAVFELDGIITGTVTFGSGRQLSTCTTCTTSELDSTRTRENMNKQEDNCACYIESMNGQEDNCASSIKDENIQRDIICGASLGDEGEIISLYVLPQYWSTKQGYQLTKFVTDRLKSQGYKSCYLWVIKENDRAVTFYKKFGFRSAKEFTTVMLAGKAVVEEKYRLYL